MQNIHHQWRELLKKAENASDIHCVYGMPIKARIHGDLYPIEGIDDHEHIESMLYGLLNEQQTIKLQQERELDFSFELDSLRYRVNMYFTCNRLSGVLRVISNIPPTLQSLDAPNVFYHVLNHKKGLILFCGATGSGKSSSIAAMLHHINLNSCKHIITIEDPIEFVHTPIKSHFSQRNLRTDTHNINNAIKSAFREDPDIIYLGEMRDKTAFELALNAAQSGHLFFSTMHSSGTVSAISRIVGSFEANAQAQIRSSLAESLLLLVAQVLVPRINGGRIAAYEILYNTPAIAHLIREAKFHQIETQIALGANNGMILLNDSLKNLIIHKQITKDNALIASYEPKSLLTI